MTVEKLNSEQKLIEEYIERFGSDKVTSKKGLLADGIVNAEKYLNRKYRILWVLKEPFDEDGG
jgi:hypothetical protein